MTYVCGGTRYLDPDDRIVAADFAVSKHANFGLDGLLYYSDGSYRLRRSENPRRLVDTLGSEELVPDVRVDTPVLVDAAGAVTWFGGDQWSRYSRDGELIGESDALPSVVGHPRLGRDGTMLWLDDSEPARVYRAPLDLSSFELVTELDPEWECPCVVDFAQPALE